MINFVVVSHSRALADEAIKLASMMKHADFQIINAAGIPQSDEFGTDVSYIIDAINQANQDDGVIVFCEIGSSLMSSQMAIEMIAHPNVILADAPFIEGLCLAVSFNFKQATLAQIKEQLEQVKNFSKQITQ
ncbi:MULTISPECIES: dihydroxyacetone kinase phosphoryl donor subunit DhaM [unclassified Mycoplasma]|uniref:dihydroxyacetone kinase phosphoryl donor subunit DhaM n=1 Tax=unclassified Mycoplasma TaxID=2683645 RepID=UPI00211CF5A6|nr:MULTISPECIES: dihydroxyacetone kinase phosphoryl donor subunit DhaM [unclassified Mycoplasma]UUM19594.1 dihydroxyacetone kinase phosphoryl donor subunit DhaM [Mycoplasma sp. 1578d]UUM24514.1 dihydroxyacetone kinase phosphoryl donor subunit DhaM [Mycoplasma sp. 3686d]